MAKVTFKFETDELVLISRALNDSKREWTKTAQGLANVVAMKIGTHFCELDGSEMELMHKALRIEAIRCLGKDLEETAEECFVIAREVDQARTEFINYWTTKLTGGN